MSHGGGYGRDCLWWEGLRRWWWWGGHQGRWLGKHRKTGPVIDDWTERGQISWRDDDQRDQQARGAGRDQAKRVF